VGIGGMKAMKNEVTIIAIHNPKLGGIKNDVRK